MHLAHIPTILQRAFPQLTWRIDQPQDAEPCVYLTFDDGPIPQVTTWVLDQLEDYGAKATFFCVGENVERYPEIYQRVVDFGHAVGNHTHRHLDCWRTDREVYKTDIAECAKHVESNLFRPPYGRLTPHMMRALAPKQRIVMWDVLSGDFDPKLTSAQCVARVQKHARPGSIIVLHDSLKAWPRLKDTLPDTLEWLGEKGWKCEVIR